MDQPNVPISMDRRRFIGLAAIAGASLATGSVLAGCSSQPRNAEPETKAEQPQQNPQATDTTPAPETQPADIDAPVAGKSLIAVFSWSGNTLKAADHLQGIVDADFFRIEPAEPYTTNYNEVLDVAQAEQNAGTLPALAHAVPDWDSYSTIYLGFPVWWYDAPQIIKSFMTAHDCSGKTVAVFSTSGGSSAESCLDSLRAIAPSATFTRSITLDGDAVDAQLDQLDTWQAGLGLQ